MSEIIRNYERVAYGLRSEYVCASCFLTKVHSSLRNLYSMEMSRTCRQNLDQSPILTCILCNSIINYIRRDIKQVATSNPLIEIHLEKSPVCSHIEAINASVHMNAKSIDWYNYCLIEVANNALTMWHETVTSGPGTNTVESPNENFPLGQGIPAATGSVINRPFNLPNNSPGAVNVNSQVAFKPGYRPREGYTQKGPQVLNWDELRTNNPGTSQNRQSCRATEPPPSHENRVIEVPPEPNQTNWQKSESCADWVIREHLTSTLAMRLEKNNKRPTNGEPANKTLRPSN